MAKLRNTIIIIICMFAIAFGTLFYLLTHKIPMNEPTDVGNSSGNMVNGGYFCEDTSGRVFFKNNYDHNCMYSMNANESDVKQVTNMNVRNIGTCGEYLYFYMDSTNTSVNSSTGLNAVTNQYGPYRSKKDGTGQVCLIREYVGNINLIGSYVYYQLKGENLGTLERIRIDKRDKGHVSDEYIDPSSAFNGVIFYTGVEKNRDLHTLDTKGSFSSKQIRSGSSFNPIVTKDYVYYLDGENDMRVSRIPINGGKVEVISKEKADYFNLNDEHIFYSTSYSESNNLTNKVSALHAAKLDGSDDKILIEGIYSNISVTSKYVYFEGYKDKSRIWHVPVNLSEKPSLFNPIRE